MPDVRQALLSAEISAIAHATEDVEKVEGSVKFLLESVFGTNVQVTRQYLKGHHGNAITTVKVTLSRKELPSNTVKLLWHGLSDSDRQFLSDHMQTCVDEDGNLYLRFNKQEAFLGNVRFHDTDPIRMRVRFASRSDAEAMASIDRESGHVS